MAYPWPARLTLALRGNGAAVANQGKSGDTCSGITARYSDEIHGQGFTGTAIMIGTNDLAASVSAATEYTCITSLLTTASADGPVLLMTVPPNNGTTGWTGAMQTEWSTLNASILGTSMANVTVLDVVPFLQDPANHGALDPLVDYGDKRHLNDVGGGRMAANISALGVVK